MRFLRFALFTILLTAILRSRAQEAAPAVELPSLSEPAVPAASEPPPPAAARKPAPPPPAEINLTLREEPDGSYVDYKDLFALIKSLDPGSGGEWDAVQGVLRIRSGGKLFHAWANQPVVVVSGKSSTVPKTLRAGNGRVLVPIETVQVLLKALNYDIQLEAPPRPGAPAASLDGMAGPAGRSAGASPAELGLPPLETPALAAERGGAVARSLDWAALADSRHPGPPRRVLLLCDPELEGLGEQIRTLVRGAAPLESFRVMPVKQSRRDPDLAAQIALFSPDAVIDLMIERGAADEAGDGTIEIWTVHDALFGETPAAKKGAPAPEAAYRPHQFQNLALGSMIRGEAARALPGRQVRFSLAPLLLARRVDAPAAAVLLPASAVEGDPQTADAVARSLAGGLIAYSRGLEFAARSRR